MNFIRTLEDRKLLGQFLAPDPSSWNAWKTFGRAIFALPAASHDDMEIYRRCTGRTSWPTVLAKEAWIIAGRRSGKSRFVSLIAAFYAIQKYKKLAAGERANIIIASPSLNQSKILRRYLSGIFTENAMLASLVVKQNTHEIVLKNNVAIVTLSGDFRTVRGFSAAAVLLDEIGFIPSDGASPDEEILRALRPALMTTNGPLIAVSSPFRRSGALYRAWENHYGKDSDVLVWQAPTELMNPSINREAIAKARSDDPVSASSEWDADFRLDSEGIFPPETIMECVRRGEGYQFFGEGGVGCSAERMFSAFVDMSGGSVGSSVLCVAHVAEDGMRVLDHVDERRPPFSPSGVVESFSATLKGYGITTVVGDRYAGSWVSEAFLHNGIDYVASDRDKSSLYAELLVHINNGRVALPNHERMIAQLVRIVRRASRSGKDSIGPPTNHEQDDLSNACAGAIAVANNLQPSFTGNVADLLCEPPPPCRLERELDLASGSGYPGPRISIRERMLKEFDF